MTDYESRADCLAAALRDVIIVANPELHGLSSSVAEMLAAFALIEDRASTALREWSELRVSKVAVELPIDVHIRDALANAGNNVSAIDAHLSSEPE